MKKINIYILGLLVLIFSSCDLDLISPSDMVKENFWKTENDAWYALNSCYSGLPSFSGGMIDEMTTDNAHSHKPWEGPMEIIQGGTITAANGWGGYSYSLIRKANNFIENVDNCEMSVDLKERMKAEASFFRAMQYLNMIVKFGRVPLVTDVLEYDAPFVPREDIDVLHAYVLSELDDIAKKLPESYPGGKMYETGRITKGAALALRARAALYFENYIEAEKSANDVIALNKYDLFKLTSLSDAQQRGVDELESLIDFEDKDIDKQAFGLGMFSYEALWQSNNAGPKNPEYILTREYMNDKSFVDWARYQYIRPSQLVRGYISYEPMQDLVDAYWDIDGKTLRESIDADTRASRFKEIDEVNYIVDGEKKKPIDQKAYIAQTPTLDLASYDYMDEFKNRDSRLYASILFPFVGWHVTDFGSPFYYRFDPARAGSDSNESWSGYAWRKMVAIDGYDAGSENHATSDFPLIRFAEILLIAAESHIQNTGYDATVQEHLNKLRDRVGMPNVPTSFSSKDEALDFLRNERRIELAGEGHRYPDIRRYGKEYAKKSMTGPTYSPNKMLLIDKKWDDKLMLMPIPQSAMDLNPLLKEDQNPGY